MQNITYSRTEYVDQYRSLTDFEFSLLPMDVKMAYLDSIYNRDIEEARKRDDRDNTIYSRGYIKHIYELYFKLNGCEVTNYGIGVEEYEVKCVDKNKKYEVSDEARSKIEYYLEMLANAKADAFESCVKRFYADMLAPMETGDVVTFREPDVHRIERDARANNLLSENSSLNDEEKRHIMEAQLSLMLDSIINGIRIIVENFSKEYQEVLSELVEAENPARDDEHQLKPRNLRVNSVFTIKD